MTTKKTKKSAAKVAIATDKARKSAIAVIEKRIAAKPETKATAKSKAAKPAKEKKAKRTSALDAAATVLASAKEPMRAKDIVEAMSAKGLWSSPNGKTPEATLHAALMREIKTKATASRFKKADRGLFASSGKAA